jgi:membrane protein implicated in regulation of membrane protease activity
MSERFYMALISGLFEEVALAAIVLLGLPALDIVLPVWALVLLMVLLAVNNTLFYWIGGRALRKPHLPGLPDMDGTAGTAVEALAPEGMVSIRGELWRAKTVGGTITARTRVVVTRQEGLLLFVRPEVEDTDDG